jgi:hypothetical protein
LERAELRLAEVPAPQPAPVTFKRARLRELRALAKVGENLLHALVSGKMVDPGPLLKVAERR